MAIPSLGICRLLYLSTLCPCGLFTSSQCVTSVLGPRRRWDCIICWFLHFLKISHVPSWSSTWVKDPGPSSPSELTFCLFLGPLSTSLLRGLRLSLCRLVVGCLSSLRSVPIWIVSCFSGHLLCERGKTIKAPLWKVSRFSTVIEVQPPDLLGRILGPLQSPFPWLCYSSAWWAFCISLCRNMGTVLPSWPNMDGSASLVHENPSRYILGVPDVGLSC